MEKLNNRSTYPAETAGHIEAMGTLAVSIANRWGLGWPERVKALLESNHYLDCLDTQVIEEKNILANEANLRHLSRHEIMQLYEIKASPPPFIDLVEGMDLEPIPTAYAAIFRH